MKTYIAIDIEANGPIPGDYSMTSLGAVIVDTKLDKTFTIHIKPISKNFDPQRLRFGTSDQTTAIDAKEAMEAFKEWVAQNSTGTPVFVSDNNGFDWMFVCWYFWHFLGKNPFGYTSMNINSLNKGIQRDLKAKLEEHRDRELTHDALEDARDTAKIFLILRDQMQ